MGICINAPFSGQTTKKNARKEARTMTIILIRTLILYFVVVFSIRLMGKRQLGELQPSELVITILISNIATLSLEDVEIPLLHGILPILVLVCFEVLMSWLSLKSVTIRRWISGSPKVIIRDGHIDQEMLRELRFSIDDLMTALRTGNVFDVEEVQYAIVETNGTVSVCLKSDYQPAQRSDVHAAGKSGDPPQVLIADGAVREGALSAIGQDRRWLESVLRVQHLQMQEVFLMTADRSHYHIIRREGRDTA